MQNRHRLWFIFLMATPLAVWSCSPYRQTVQAHIEHQRAVTAFAVEQREAGAALDKAYKSGVALTIIRAKEDAAYRHMYHDVDVLRSITPGWKTMSNDKRETLLAALEIKHREALRKMRNSLYQEDFKPVY